jgi:phosphoserine aminotransferase
MLTFYPGPSKVYPAVADWAAQAVREGIVSLNHRSTGFMAIVAETIRLLHDRLALPPDYHVALVGSATECWEIVAQSLTGTGSLHPTPGSFAEKWRDYAHRINPAGPEPDVLAVVQNETSNGTQLTMAELAAYRQSFGGLLAVDAVSSMAGVAFNWLLGDVWFASVQKCFGLPAGLAVLIYSPNALLRAERLNDRSRYNSLLFLHENFEKNQTPYTPNGLGIYLLMRALQTMPPIDEVDAGTKRRAADWYSFLETDLAASGLRPLIGPAPGRQPGLPPAVRSDTVIAVEGTPDVILDLKARARLAGFILGNGYGAWKETTVRIANFPAITNEEIAQLKTFLLMNPVRRSGEL